MKQLYTRLKLEFKELKYSEKYLKLFRDISSLSNQNLSTKEIEIFLGISLSDFDETFFNLYFKSYAELLKYLNVIQLCIYISFVECLKQKIILTSIKKLLYPLFLLMMTFTVLVIFKFALMDVMSDFTSSNSELLITVVYTLSLVTIISIVILILVFIIIFRNPVTTIIGYNRLSKFSLFNIIEYYYLSVFTYLLLSFYKEGYSTMEILKIINKFKNNQVISNLAYFLNSDLEEGIGIEDSIINMNVNDTFKNVLLFSLKSSNFEMLLSEFSKQLMIDIKRQINIISKGIYALSYIYIGIVVLLLYKILSMPLSMLSDF